MSIDQNNSVFDKIKNDNHEQIVFCNDESLGLKAIIGIHNTALGPSIGGTRMWNYSSDNEALRDVINLSKAMSYKSSLAGLNAGGGKAVIIGDPKLKSESFIKRFADFINDLNGKYWTAQDVNMSTQDIVWVKERSNYVVGLPKEHGGLGDSSSPTAYGVYVGMKSAVKHITGNDSLKDKKVLVQGVGNVGRKLVHHLLEEEANVSVVDLTVKLNTETTYDEIMNRMESASKNELKNILGFSSDDVVSQDFIGDVRTSIIDSKAGIQLNSKFYKIITWYDNEAGYSSKLLDLAQEFCK